MRNDGRRELHWQSASSPGAGATVWRQSLLQLRRPRTAGALCFSREERERHVWIVGKSGSGKSTMLFNLAMCDIVAGEGVAVIDPHGDLARTSSTPSRARASTTCATSTPARPSIRSASIPRPGSRPSAARSPPPASSRRSSTCGRDSWGPRLEHFLFHGVAALISREHATLIDLARLYTDDRFRERVVAT